MASARQALAPPRAPGRMLPQAAGPPAEACRAAIGAMRAGTRSGTAPRSWRSRAAIRIGSFAARGVRHGGREAAGAAGAPY
ncbi:hypothetical protein [Streptomyces sp. NPDC002054]|uniref:hypothetical protein n=1 Tax=Streptomyces sp. NPDC002054 TaxID=3154663 RepID=UPI00331BDF03